MLLDTVRGLESVTSRFIRTRVQAANISQRRKKPICVLKNFFLKVSPGQRPISTYTSIENFSGSWSASDIVIGSAAANVMFGFGGNDALNGGAGGDYLAGNAGADTLVGDLGNDFFYYVAASEIGDLILDFANADGNNDAFQISAAGFGGCLVAGVLSATRFQTRADNAAQDADDRFIYRTTDRTLWYDVDGTGASAAIMLADLHAGASVTTTDIVIV